MAPNPGVPAPFPHLVVGQPDPERGPQAADGLGEEGLAVGVGDGGQGGVEGLAEQQGLVPPEGFLQDAVSAVVVKEGAGGRGGVRRPRGAQERVWGSKETRSEDAPACRGVASSPSWGVHEAAPCVHGTRAPGWGVHVPGGAARWRGAVPTSGPSIRMHVSVGLRLMCAGGAPQTMGARCSSQVEPVLLPPPTAPCSPQADPITPSSLAVAPPHCGVLG